MKKPLLPVFALALILGACSSTEKKEAQAEATPVTVSAPKIEMDHSLLASNKDLNCGMELSEIGDTVTYKGKIYGFCSTECKEKFLANADSLIQKQ